MLIASVSVLLNHKDYGLDNNLNAIEYWSKVFKLKNPAGENMFSDLKVVISLRLCLPASNTSRNKLGTSTICALIHTKQAVKDFVSFEPSNTLIKKKWNE